MGDASALGARMRAWQMALIWMAVLEAEAKRVKLGADTVLEVEDVMPSLRLKHIKSVRPAAPRSCFCSPSTAYPYHPPLILIVSRSQLPLARLHLAKFEAAILGLLIASLHTTVKKPIPFHQRCYAMSWL